MTLIPNKFMPLDEVYYLHDSKSLFDAGHLHYYDITNEGPKEKNFLGKVWAWILNFLGFKTNFATYIHSTHKYLNTIPEDLASLASRMTLSDFNEDQIGDINLLALAILNDRIDHPSLRALEKITNFDSLKSELEQISIEIPISDEIESIEDPVKKYFKFLLPSKQSKEYLLESFKRDCYRQAIFIEDSLTGQLEDVSSTSPSFLTYQSQQLDLNNSYLNFIEERIKHTILMVWPGLSDEDLEKKLQNIELFLNQSTGNDLLGSNPNYDRQLLKKFPDLFLFDEEAYDLSVKESSKEFLPLWSKLDPKTIISSSGQEISYGGTWHIHDGDDRIHCIAKILSQVSLNFTNKKLTIRPIIEFEITEDCNIIQLYRLAARFLR